MSIKNTSWNSALRLATLSDVGMRRAINQDSLAVQLAQHADQWQEHGHLLLVADGMGAHAAGELASKMAADHVPHLYLKHHDLSPPAAVEAAVRGANEEIFRRGQQNIEFHNMGTTCSVLLLLPQGAIAAHVGDSRVYMLRGTELVQLTFDHSLVWEMRAAGQISAADDVSHDIPRNVITRSLGPHPNVNVDLEGPFPIAVGDIFLLCSDGLNGCVTDEEIASALSYYSPEQASQFLVDLANLRGGPDNITVVLAEVADEQMATEIDAKPLSMAHSAESSQPIAAGWWIAGCTSLLAAGVMWMAQQPVLAAIAGIVVVVICGYVFIRKLIAMNRNDESLVRGQQLGKGPHVRVQRMSESAFVSNLSELVSTAYEAAVQRGWSFDEAEIRQHLASAEKARQLDDTQTAVQGYAASLHILVECQRKHTRGHESTDAL